ncbi:MAG: peptidase M75 [Prevotellaceae bacterium]|jgi:hypothetical protein|nr:peptidase M75 [Prevotellaceae bacterium]
MKKNIFLPVIVLALLGFSACTPDPDPVSTGSENELYLEKVVPNYVENTVVTIYKLLADESIDLYEALVSLKAEKSAANLQKAAEEWIVARKYWEQSEAFLFGAAADFGIDPHIDTWPLDKNALIAELSNAEHIAAMAGEDGPAWAGEKLGPGLLGFHGIEYILFEQGQVKSNVSSISDNELIYAVAVAGDLRNQCIRLEAAWAGIDNVSEEKQQIIEEFDLVITIGGRQNYGDNMKSAGKVGSTYKTITDAAEDIIQGCIDIADEVATMKIGKPNSGDDIHYIESPYSYNSTKDFVDNIESIRFAYLGGVETRNESMHAFFEKVNKNLDAEILAAIDNAVVAINAIRNFETNPSSAEATAAIEVVNELTGILEGAVTELRKAVQ